MLYYNDYPTPSSSPPDNAPSVKIPWKDYPTNLDFEFDFSDSTWYNITERYVAQSGNEIYDGFVEVFIDGVLVLQHFGIRTGKERYYMNQFALRYFLGGGSYVFAPASDGEVDQYMLIHSIYLFTFKTGYGPDLGFPSQAGRVLTNLPGWDTANGKIK